MQQQQRFWFDRGLFTTCVVYLRHVQYIYDEHRIVTMSTEYLRRTQNIYHVCTILRRTQTIYDVCSIFTTNTE